MSKETQFFKTVTQQQKNEIQKLVEAAKEKNELAFKLEPDYLNPKNPHNQHILYIEENQIKGYALVSRYEPAEIEVAVVLGEAESAIVKAIYQAILDITAGEKVTILFVIDRKDSFLKQQLAEMGLAYSFGEERMNFGGNLELLSKPHLSDEIQLYPATEQDKRQIAILDGQESTTELAEVEVKGTYLARYQDQIIGKVRLEESLESIGIYGFMVESKWRGKGLGRIILLKALQNCLSSQEKLIYLEVDCENQVAANLYRSLGFQSVVVFDYFS